MILSTVMCRVVENTGMEWGGGGGGGGGAPRLRVHARTCDSDCECASVEAWLKRTPPPRITILSCVSSLTCLVPMNNTLFSFVDKGSYNKCWESTVLLDSTYWIEAKSPIRELLGKTMEELPPFWVCCIVNEPCTLSLCGKGPLWSCMVVWTFSVVL